jgi:mutator protein MutT
MFIKIYFGDKPVFLCDEVDEIINEYRHHADAVYIDEATTPAINSLLHEIVKPQFHAGIILDKDLEHLKKLFFRHFTIIQAAGGVVRNNDNELLLIFRRGKWDLPKGKLDEGESLEECAVREVQEETGLKHVKGEEYLHTSYHTYNEFGKHILKETYWYSMLYKGHGKLIPQTEEDITEIKWVKPSALQQYLNNTYPIIEELLHDYQNT